MSQWSGNEQCNLYEGLGFRVETGAALPAFVATYRSRLFFVTTGGANYGLWVGGEADWIQLGGASGNRLLYRTDTTFVPAGAGVPNTFDLLTLFGTAPGSPGDVMLFVNGLAMQQGATSDFTVAGALVTYNNDASRYVLQAGDEVSFLYAAPSVGSPVTVHWKHDTTFVPAGAGAPNAFDLSSLFSDTLAYPSDLVLFVNGQAMRYGTDYSAVGNVVTYNNVATRYVLQAGDEVSFLYQVAASGGQPAYRTVAAAIGAPGVQGVAEPFDFSALFGLSIDNPNDLVLFVNGQAKRQGATMDYSVAGDIASYLNDPVPAGRYILQTGDIISSLFEF